MKDRKKEADTFQEENAVNSALFPQGEAGPYQKYSDHLWETFNNLLLYNMEHGFVHNPHNQELREAAAIENGNVEELRSIIENEHYEDRNGKIAFDPLRQEINIGIVVITRSRYAAARGGVQPEICFSLSDAAIQEMEKCSEVLGIRHIYRSAELRYAMLVREKKLHPELPPSPGENRERRDDLHVSHCKDYVFSHLNSHLTVAEVARAIGLEPNYLSALFHRCEHITLKQFILREKINLAKNMLAYSPYSYIEIANYLGFSSQSHLGQRFREITGMTPRQYRQRYGKEDFLHDVMKEELES